MERGSNKHGPRLDDALDEETRPIVQGGHDARGQEWHSAEPAGEDQPDVDRVPDGTAVGGLPAGLTPEDVEGRSELAALLGKELWPAAGTQVKSRVHENNAPDRLIDLVDRLPDGRVYENVAEVWQDLAGGTEQHRF